VWSGWGILTLLIGAACGAGGTGIGVALGGARDHANLGTAVGLAVAGVLIWFVGQRLNRPATGTHPAPVTNRHRFFFVPMQYWGPLAGVGAIVAAVLNFTS
jgi:hypothetical protein